MKRSRSQKLVYISLLSAQAVILSLVEKFIPSPLTLVPGARLGLANIITIFAIFTLPLKHSFAVVMVKIILSSLIGGHMSVFLYSIAGGLLSFIGMCLAKQMGPEKTSIIGISILGGVLHNFGQLTVAAIFARSFSVMNYLPILNISGIMAGFMVGILGNYLLERVKVLKLYHDELVTLGYQMNWLR